MDARGVVKRVGHKMSLDGCINNAQTLYQGTPEDVYSQARYAIEAGVNVIGPECAIPLATPLENLKAVTSAVCDGY
jgi:uroporphyrinogen-III decarboxylase